MMTQYNIAILSQAKKDIREVRSYYKNALPGLEKRFYSDLKVIIGKISSNPYIFGFRFEHFRTANLRVFPYQLHYFVDESKLLVVIFAVLHSSRNPDFVISTSKS